jgi:hypothetical protein
MKDDPAERFYLGFLCHKCRKPIEVVIDDATDACHFIADDVLEILCPACQHRGQYASRQVQWFSQKD